MNEVDRAGRVPLHYAALENDAEQVASQLAAGADPDSADWAGFTPLHIAAQQGSLEAAQVLLDGGATVDSVNKHGNTPLWVAVFNSQGRGDLIRLLHERGADPWRKNLAGETPWDLPDLSGTTTSRSTLTICRTQHRTDLHVWPG
jgi:uncharacterized protein